MNTGIMEEIPILLPEDTKPYSFLFDTLQELHMEGYASEIKIVESFSEALVYASYLTMNGELSNEMQLVARSLTGKGRQKLLSVILHQDIQELIHEILIHPTVERIESSPRME